MRKSIKYTGILLALIIIGGFIFSYMLIKNSLPQHEGVIQFAEINNKVEITFDKMGIPQIWAQNETDAYFAMGYLHASDRMFQMDMTRRVAQGRLADLLGPTVLEIDIHQRTVGHDRIAQKFLNKLSSANKIKLQVYADGVNAYKKTCKAKPFEFQLLGQDFDDWTVYDCLSIMSFQTWFSDYLMSPDAFLTEAVDKLGYDKIRSLNFSYPEWGPLSTPQSQTSAVPRQEKSGPGQNSATASKSIREIFAEQIFKEVDLPFRMANSSNSWVIAPHRSASGKAILASDPHLEITRLPQFWYQLGIHIEETGASILGISTPGLPLITMGHNGHIAWAFTVSGVDVNEYFQEKFDPQDSTRYLTSKGWESLQVLPQEIFISGQDKSYQFDVLSTIHGPLIFEQDSLKERYALHWAGYDIDLDDCFSAGFDFAYVDNFRDFQKTVTRFGALDANWTYADKNGNIGYQLGTPVAIRPDKSDNLPVPGWTGEFEWQGYQPLDKTPSSYNPPRGWLASCNNKQDQPNLDYQLHGYFASDRILRIDQLMKSKEKFNVQDMYDFQMDTKDAYLLRWKPIISSLLEEHGKPEEAAEIQQWDGSTSTNSSETALVAQFISRLRHLTFDDELGKLLPRISKTELEQVWRDGPFDWFDNIETLDTIETKKEIAQKALFEALQIRQTKTWGDFHTLTMQHPLSVVPVISDLLNLKYGPFPWAGTAGTLNASFYFEDKKNPTQFVSAVGPSWRFVIDFANIDKATIVLPAGNSGNPASPHFMDFFEMWKNGARWNVPLSKGKVFEQRVETLILSSAN